ncbi:MAG: LysE family transporter, partial [Giesbergeria sp.]
SGPSGARGGAADAAVPLVTVFRRGFLTNVLNPKVALFFLAFVPQFIAPGSAHAPAMFLLLGLLFTFNSTLVNTGWACAAAWAARRAGAMQRAMRWLDGVAGSLFIGFGVKLALTDAPAGP